MADGRKAPSKAQVMLTFRVYPEQYDTIKRAVDVHPEGLRGVSHFARESLLDWAAATLARASRKDRAA
jgi:hypothetical protein